MMFPDDFQDPDDHLWDQAERAAVEAWDWYEKGQMQQAMEKLAEALELNPANGACYFNMGLTLDAMERYEEAIGYYTRAREIGGEDVEILNALAVDFTRTCEYERALTLFEKIETMDPTYEPGYCNRIITYTELEQHEKAEQMFYLAQQIHADCPICFYNIGNSLFSRGQYDRAVWCWERTAALDPQHPQIHYRIAQACWAAGRKEQATEAFLKELRGDPGNVEVLLDFGIFLLETGRIESAGEKFNRILELDPEFAPAFFYKGETLLHLEREGEAECCYRQAVETDRKLKGPRFRLAQLCARSGRTEEAIRYLNLEIAADPDDPDVLLAMAWTGAQLGQLESACRC